MLLMSDRSPGARNPSRRTAWRQLALCSGTGSCTECPSHALALPPGHLHWPSMAGTRSLPRESPQLQAQLSGRMTPFFLLISVPSYPEPPPSSVPADNAPGPGRTPCALPGALHAQHTHVHVHTQVRAHTHTHTRSPTPEASGICRPSGICVRQTGWAGLQPQRPRAPGHPGVCPGCLGNHFRSFETIRSLSSVWD